MDMNARIAKAVEDRRTEILDLSRRIHADPELAFEEVRTSRLLQSVLLAEGFDVSPASEGLPTSFRAVYGPSANGPRVTFTAEMDALPGLGHACGHNIIGTAGTYAAIVLKSVLGRDLAGTIEVVAHSGRGTRQRQGPHDPGRGFRAVRRRPPDPSPLARHGRRPGPGPADARRRILRQEGPRRGRAPRGPERPRRPRPLLPFGRPAPDEVPGGHALPRDHRGGRRGAEHHPRLRPRPVLTPGGHDGQARAPRRRGQVPRREGRRGDRVPGQDQRARTGCHDLSPQPRPRGPLRPAYSRNGAGPIRPSSGSPTARPTWPMSPGSSRRSSR